MSKDKHSAADVKETLTVTVAALVAMTEELRDACDKATAAALVAMGEASKLSGEFTSEGLEKLKQATTMLGVAEGLAEALDIVQTRNTALLEGPLAQYFMA